MTEEYSTNISPKKISLQDNPLVNGGNVDIKLSKLENLSNCTPIDPDKFDELLTKLKSSRHLIIS
jgi:hypothetical protein